MFGNFGRTCEAGMYAYVADAINTPYRLSKKNSRLLKAWHTYYSRVFETPDGILIDHHSMNGGKLGSGRHITFLAPFKKLVLDEEGNQRWM